MSDVKENLVLSRACWYADLALGRVCMKHTCHDTLYHSSSQRWKEMMGFLCGVKWYWSVLQQEVYKLMFAFMLAVLISVAGRGQKKRRKLDEGSCLTLYSCTAYYHSWNELSGNTGEIRVPFFRCHWHSLSSSALNSGDCCLVPVTDPNHYLSKSTVIIP